MIARIAIHPDQIRWYVQNALNSFETLDREDAVENAMCDLRALLAYLDSLDAADKAVLVSGVAGVEPGVGLELRVRKPDDGHKPHLKIARFPTV